MPVDDRLHRALMLRVMRVVMQSLMEARRSSQNLKKEIEQQGTNAARRPHGGLSHPLQWLERLHLKRVKQLPLAMQETFCNSFAIANCLKRVQLQVAAGVVCAVAE